MRIIYTKSFDSTLKKLKKHKKVERNLKEITERITNHDTFTELRNNPIMTTTYNFHALKYENRGFWSFNLEKHGGVIRLIVIPSKLENEVVFVYISYDHYLDFTPENSNIMMNKFGKELGEFLESQNISIKEFSDRINTTSKNLIDIIKGDIELSQNMIYNISFTTGIPVSYIENTEQNYKMDKTIKRYLEENNLSIRKYINKFNYKEAEKIYDIVYRDSKNDYTIAKDLLKYLRITNPNSLTKENNVIFYKSKNDKPELLALWLEKCNRTINKQILGTYQKENINNLVEVIKKEAKNNQLREEKLVQEFNKNGIYLAIQEDLKGTKVRGAFKVLGEKPAIFITKKHKRYADIYFALLHELAHCKSDFNRAKKGSIISLEEEKSKEDYELKADQKALNWMVPDEVYNRTKYEVEKIEELEVVKSFYVYRLAKDNIISYSDEIYQKYNTIIKE